MHEIRHAGVKRDPSEGQQVSLLSGMIPDMRLDSVWAEGAAARASGTPKYETPKWARETSEGACGGSHRLAEVPRCGGWGQSGRRGHSAGL